MKKTLQGEDILRVLSKGATLEIAL